MKSGIGFLMISSLVQLAISSCPSDCQCDGNDVTCSSLGLSDVPRNNIPVSVNSLDLSSNSIISLNNTSFLGFTELSTLYLSYNEIKYIDVSAFHELKELRDIDLSNNALETIHPEIFSNNPHLQSVSLNRNPLAHLPVHRPFLISSSVRCLDLSFCSLNYIYPETFRMLRNLHSMDLSSNLLQTFPNSALSDLTHLRLVDLGNNRWKCSCEARELFNWINTLRDFEPAHAPVKCIENGQYRTLWSVTNPFQTCSQVDAFISNVDQDEGHRLVPKSDTSKSLQTQRDDAVVEGPKENAELHQIFPDESTLNMENSLDEDTYEAIEVKEKVTSPVADSSWSKFLSLNADIIIVLAVLPIMLGVSIFITLMLVNYFSYNMGPHIRLVDRDDQKEETTSVHIYEQIPEDSYLKRTIKTLFHNVTSTR
ncbi:hypothetical protein L9F63_014376 [Diploptera punctata]|uniref:Uncharacterized protein n=1 Tax=Diploptera punctata TaxID=6984 RepID=A0AAD8A803_DIPPU|nr:hypothetical protein L9F63_014376 [Diploptera punctata]